MPKFGIAARLALIVFLGCAGLGATLGGTDVWQSYRAASEASEARLIATASARADALEREFDLLRTEMVLISEAPRIPLVFQGFLDSWDELGDNPGAQVQALYIENNPHPEGQREQLRDAGDGSSYSRIHHVQHAWNREFLESRGYYDLFFVSGQGDVIYSVRKERDFGSNIQLGPYANSGLGAVYRAAMVSEPRTVSFHDYELYEPSDGAAASFLAVPIDLEGVRAAVMIVQVPADRLNSIMGAETGLGETGDAFILGEDGRFRSNLRSAEGRTLLTQTVNPALTTELFERRIGVSRTADLDGRPALLSFRVLDFLGTSWVVVITQDPREAYAAARALAYQKALITIFITVLAGALATMVAVQLARPILRISAAARSLARGELSTTVPHQKAKTEIGELARSVEQLKTDAVVRLDLESRQAKTEARLAKDAERTKAAFIANVSHEIRTPLNGVVSAISLMEMSQLTPDQQQLLTTLRLSATSLGKLINDILDLSKIEAGQMVLEPKPTSVAEICEIVATILGPAAREKALDILVWCDPDLPASMTLDPERLHQIITNLMGNAIKFTGGDERHKGRIILHAYCHERDGVDRLAIDIVDNGCGISESGVQALFERFQQVDRAESAPVGGTGLGLAISRNFAHLMDGNITVKSRLGRGSTFTLSLPIDPAERAPVPFEPALEGVRVILSGPDRSTLTLFREMLVCEGASVELCVGHEALVTRLASPEGRLGADDVVVVDMDWATLFEEGSIQDEFDRLDALDTGSADMVLSRFYLSEELCEPARPNLHCLRDFPLRTRNLIGAVAAAAGREFEDHQAPSARSEIVRRPPPTPRDAEAAGRLVLLVEDNAINRNLMARQLNAIGYAVLTAEDGETGWSQFLNHRFGVVLTDLHMPGMDGFELSQAIRQCDDVTRRNTPIVMVTAAVLRDQPTQFREAGIDAHLVKPLDLHALQNEMTRWLPLEPLTGSDEIEEAEPVRPVKRKVPVSAKEVDTSALRLLVGGDDAMRDELVEEFISTTSEQMQVLRAAIEDEDEASSTQIAHKLVSSSRAFGALRLADLLGRIERAGAGADGVERGDLLVECEEAFKRAKVMILNEKMQTAE
jgi:signal transduction histidine kinase/DNA-binding response OmpR family regulator